MSTNLSITTAVGKSVPPFTPHTICVCLPTWKDNVDYRKNEKRVLDAMVIGYPRFYIHHSVRKLAGICEQRFGVNGERCFLFPTSTVANHCHDFITRRAAKDNVEPSVRITKFLLHPNGKGRELGAELHIVLFPADNFQHALPFWQHTGLGISSRYAEHCLSLLPEEIVPASPTIHTEPYVVKEEPEQLPIVSGGVLSSTYPEEHDGRDISEDAVASAKCTLRRRIAGMLLRDGSAGLDATNCEPQPSTRGLDVTEDDVYLYPTGMAAIWSAHQMMTALRPGAKSVAFGWLYVDTVKVLEGWGPGCHLFGFGNEEDIDRLEALLEQESKKNPGYPPIMSLSTEFPTNPLVHSPNLRRLRALADKYEFPIIIDQTIGNFINVEVMPYADVVVNSLSKVFSGYANVMGGSLVVNPQGRHYRALKDHLSSAYEDMYYGEDALRMERNSRDLEQRIKAIDGNAEAVSDLLRSHSLHAGGAIKHVFYPKWTSRENYDRCRKRGPDGVPTGGFGGLLSLTFHSDAACRAFFDSLPINKGPTLGTNFSLACPYTIIAHFKELEWAAEYGVVEGLVRISVGMEEREDLLGRFKIAIEAAEAAIQSGRDR